MTEVRVRFAPSPTGHLHIGGARTALINWAFARRHGGAFVLRIEDTDQERSTEASLESIIAALKWLGLEWDESIDTGGPYGPYRQSECYKLYESEAEKLLKAGDAYYCYCPPEELEQRRKMAIEAGRSPGYDNRCQSLSAAQEQAYIREGREPVVRFRVPKAGAILVDDIIRGRVNFDPDVISDFIILRADKRPTFHFANVIDDLRMRITHVIRGDDHLSNTPRHVVLFKALGAEPPRFAHHSLIHGPDGARLSKRHGATSVEEFKRAGYMQKALVNMIALLGFSPSEGEEVFSIEEFAQKFDLAALGKSAAVFDKSKLDWLNGVYIRKMPPEELLEFCTPHFREAGYDLSRYSEEMLVAIVDSIQAKITLIPDCVEEAAPFFEPIEKLLQPDAKEYLESSPLAKEVIAALAVDLNGRDAILSEDVRAIGKALQKETGAKGKDIYMPIRAAVTGRLHGPELAKALSILGKAECLRRIEIIQNLI